MERLRYLVMRCSACKRALTRLEIISKWEEMEKDESRKIGICPCGGRQLKPSNFTPEEEKRLGGLWQRFRYYVLRKDDEGTRLFKLYEKCVKNKELGVEYGDKALEGNDRCTANRQG